MPKIYLIGMMGSGKSVTAKALAEQLNLQAVDIDELLEKKFESKIADIFKHKGEPYFRKQEAALLTEIVSPDVVVATGGGIILDTKNVQWMKKNGTIIYLETSLDDLWQRVSRTGHRPLLKGSNPRKAMERIFSERSSLYKSAADFSVNTDGKKAEDVAADILEKVKS